MGEMRTLDQADVAGKRVLCRFDFNVPLVAGRVGDDTRILEALPTINNLLDRGARVIMCSHLGRPAGTGYEPELSLAPVARRLVELIDRPVTFVNDIIGEAAHKAAERLEDGQVMMIENLRFDKREKKNDPEFARELASLAEVYVDDAFGAAHRAHASITGVTEYLPSYAGLLLTKEVNTLNAMLENPKRPFVAILGGSKVSDKTPIIESLIDKCDTLIIGGGMCFTFLAAQGKEIGMSLMEKDWMQKCSEMLEKAKAKGVDLLLPVDVVCASEFSNDAEVKVVSVDEIPSDMMGLDIGPETIRAYAHAISAAHTVFWNGPMGVFEMPSYEAGTKSVAVSVAANFDAETVIGGGDSVAAVNKFNLGSLMSFISTGGGASMALVQGDPLPGVEALKD